MAVKTQVSEWRIFLNDIALHLTKENVKTVLFLYAFPAGLAETVKDAQSLLLALEEAGFIKENDVEQLRAIIEDARRKDLLPKIQQYQDKRRELKNKSSKLDEQPATFQDQKCMVDLIDSKPASVTKQGARKTSFSSAAAQAGVILLKPSYFTSISNVDKTGARKPCASEESSVIASASDDDYPGGDDAGPSSQGVSICARCKPVLCTCLDAQQFPRHDKPRASEAESMQEQYKVESLPRGKCLIINNLEFKGVKVGNVTLGDREGTQIDGKIAESTFKWLCFAVEVHGNKNSDEIKKILQTCANEDHGRYDMFTCIMMSHGFEGGIYGVDGKEVSITEISRLFQKAKTLAGKPKLFFVQACQGEHKMDFICTDTAEPPNNSSRFCSRRSLAAESDFLFAVATTPGSVSWRSTDKGSWFIQSLCDTLRQRARVFDINQILTEVNKVVAELSVKVGRRVAKQVSDFGRNTLRKQLYLKPTSTYEEYAISHANDGSLNV